MKIVKFSKKNTDIITIKKNFFFSNKKNLEERVRINKLYIKQPKRKMCKNCNLKLGKTVFKSFGVSYAICKRCYHLNGMQLETKKFLNNLYSENKGKNYYKNYSNQFKNIYDTKVNFLKQVINEKINLLDIGSGAGHFLKACEIKNIKAIGFEPSKLMTKIAESKLTKNKIINISLDEIHAKIASSKENVLALIGVLEHLEQPTRLLESFKKSKIKYLYLSLPLFSLSSLIENSFPKVFPRHLSGAHTHLYTYESIMYFTKKFNFKIEGEWWFGSDFLDLYRSLLNSENRDTKIYKQMLDKYFLKNIDSFQNILDKKKISSEVHLILKKK
jgi:hypothetical protein